MAQLLNLEPNGITPPFRAMFQMLLHPAQYELKGNVPALVELLKAYMRKPGNGPESTRAVVIPHLKPVLGVWQKLCCSKSTEMHALNMLEVIVSSVPTDAYGAMLGQILSILIQRLLKVKGLRFKYLFIPTFLFLVGKIGGTPIVNCVEQLKGGMFATLTTQVILPNVAQIPGTFERKKCLVGLCRLAAETEQMKSPTFRPVAQAVAQCIVKLVQTKDPCAKVQDDDNDTGDGAAEIAYNSNSGFSRLSFATAKQSDSFPEVKADSVVLAKQSLMTLNTIQGGVLAQSGTEVSSFISG